MTARIRNLGLAGIVIGGSILFGVGFAGAQAPATSEAPKETRVVSSDTLSPTGDGGGGCDHGEVSAVNAADY